MDASYLMNEYLTPLRRQASGGDVWDMPRREVSTSIELDTFGCLEMLASVYRVSPGKLAASLLTYGIDLAMAADPPVEDYSGEMAMYLEAAELQQAATLRLGALRDRWRSSRTMERELPKLHDGIVVHGDKGEGQEPEQEGEPAGE